MKLNMFLMISAIIAMVFGLGFVLLPGFVFSIYGLPGNPPTLLGFRFFGSALISLALITWLVKHSAEWTASEPYSSATVSAIFLAFWRLSLRQSTAPSMPWVERPC